MPQQIEMMRQRWPWDLDSLLDFADRHLAPGLHQQEEDLQAREMRQRLEGLDVVRGRRGEDTAQRVVRVVVPARLHRGKFYALAESPQIFKQLFMVAGYDKYFQIVRCFRDEDLRLDRQLEFTQIDIEMSFCNQDDVFRTVEHLIFGIWKAGLGVDLHELYPDGRFPRLGFADAMRDYGVDTRLIERLQKTSPSSGRRGSVPLNRRLEVLVPRDKCDPGTLAEVRALLLYVGPPPLGFELVAGALGGRG